MARLDRGSGQPILLMHGTMMDHRMFEPQVEELADEFRVIAYDLRALTAAQASPYDLYDLAADCIEELDAIDADRGVIGGMSMGAFAALRVGLRYPERTAGLVLIGGQAEGLSPSDQEAWGAHYASQRELDQVDPTFAAEEARLNFGDGAVASDPALLERWVERFRSRNGEAVYWETHSWLGKDDMSELLGRVECPVLVVHGEEDAAVPVSRARTMAAGLPNAELCIVPGAGHAVNLERPEVVNAAIRDFVRGLRS